MHKAKRRPVCALDSHRYSGLESAFLGMVASLHRAVQRTRLWSTYYIACLSLRFKQYHNPSEPKVPATPAPSTHHPAGPTTS